MSMLVGKGSVRRSLVLGVNTTELKRIVNSTAEVFARKKSRRTSQRIMRYASCIIPCAFVLKDCYNSDVQIKVRNNPSEKQCVRLVTLQRSE
jgi:hypothetical protein